MTHAPYGYGGFGPPLGIHGRWCARVWVEALTCGCERVLDLAPFPVGQVSGVAVTSHGSDEGVPQGPAAGVRVIGWAEPSGLVAEDVGGNREDSHG